MKPHRRQLTPEMKANAEEDWVDLVKLEEDGAG
jgi:hypothetical protein